MHRTQQRERKFLQDTYSPSRSNTMFLEVVIIVFFPQLLFSTHKEFSSVKLIFRIWDPHRLKGNNCTAMEVPSFASTLHSFYTKYWRFIQSVQRKPILVSAAAFKIDNMSYNNKWWIFLIVQTKILNIFLRIVTFSDIPLLKWFKPSFV